MARDLFLSAIFIFSSAFSFADAALTCTPSSSPPANAVCNVRGRIRDVAQSEAAASPFPASTFRICRDIALSRTYAYLGSFSWNSDTQICRTALLEVGQLNFTADPTSPNIHSDGACFECRTVCPEPTGANLVTNGGFERSDTLPGPWKLRLAQGSSVTSPGLGSPNALTNPSGNGIAFQILRGTCTDTYYSVSMDYRLATNSTIDRLRLFFGVEFAWNPVVPTESVGRTTIRDYFKISSPLILPIVYARVTGSRGVDRRFDVDNVSIVPFTRALRPASGSPELLTNGDFDTGSLSPWTAAEPRFGRIIPADGGGFLLQLFSGNFYTLRQNVELSPGVEYLLTFDYTAYNATEPGDHWSVWANIDSRQLGPYTQYIERITQQGSFRYALPFVARQSAAELSFNIQRSCGGFVCPNGFLFDIDNISLRRLAGAS